MLSVMTDNRIIQRFLLVKLKTLVLIYSFIFLLVLTSFYKQNFSS